jgi:hypothetical protein
LNIKDYYLRGYINMTVAYLKKEPGKNAGWKKGSIIQGDLPTVLPVSPYVYSEIVSTPKSYFDLPFSFGYDFRTGEFIGAVSVYLNGELQHRNFPQSGTSQHYSEVETYTGSGVSSRILFNTTLPTNTVVAFIAAFMPYDIGYYNAASIASLNAQLATLQVSQQNDINVSSIVNGATITTITHPIGVNRPLNLTVYKYDAGNNNWLQITDSSVTVTCNASLTQTTVTNVSAGTTDFHVVWA